MEDSIQFKVYWNFYLWLLLLLESPLHNILLNILLEILLNISFYCTESLQWEN